MKAPVNCLTTSSCEVTGFGNNFLFLITAYALARRFGCYYFHTPLGRLVYSTQNGYDQEGDREINDYVLNCLLPADRLISIHGEVRYINNTMAGDYPGEPVGELGGEHIVTVSPPKNPECSIDGSDVEYTNVPANFEEIKKALSQPLHKNRVVRIFGTYADLWLLSRIWDNTPSLILDIRDELIEKYRQSPHVPPTYFHKEEINIAIHSRRYCSPPDNEYCNTPERMLFTPGSVIDQFFCSMVNEISQKLIGHAACFHFYGHAKNKSASSEYDHFAKYLNDPKHRIEVHLNERPTTTLHHFITADILYMAKSAFSLSAHFYSKGPVLVRQGFLEQNPWCGRLLPHVYSVEHDGKFDETIIARLLERKGA